MVFRQLFRVLLRRTGPVMYAAASMFVSNEESDEPNADAKIHWEPPDLTKFTYEFMIKQSTVDTVNSVTQALTVTYAAIESTSKDYRKSLALLMSLIKETLAYKVSDLHWDLIVAARAEMQKKKQAVTHLVSYMEYVQKLGVAATEAGYMAGMDNLSLTLCQRMDDALNNTTRQVAHNLQLEKEYIILQEECVKQANAKEAAEKTEEDEGPDVDVETTQTRST